ncbi:hypothetical protein KC963_00775 [Candidatus Saccharibacteria bacterium]|nr:hypothetical protein [Candidatus Saccharibacteria bacterium]MCA9337657.1 hypothetical protein [Candidatus Saccharibacteria bacterium]
MQEIELEQLIARAGKTEGQIDPNLFRRSNFLQHIHAENLPRTMVQEALLRLGVVTHDDLETLERYLTDEQPAFYSREELGYEPNVDVQFMQTALGMALNQLGTLIDEHFGVMYEPQIQEAQQFGSFILQVASQSALPETIKEIS